jgi:predicted DNA binding CopG/RHH family protein
MSKLDKEEQEILNSFEAGNLKQSKNSKAQLEQHKRVAEAAFKKDTRINIRLSLRDLRSLQARALKEGIPYQTLVSSVLHKFVDGQLIDKATNK